MKIQGTTFLILLSAFIIVLSSCRKDKELVQGEVVFQVYDTTSFYSSNKLFERLDLKIKEASGFNYFIETSQDTADSIISILSTKSYLRSGGLTFGVLYLSDTLQIEGKFFDIDSIKASDWFVTIAILHIKEKLSQDFLKWGLLIVPIGKEQYWSDKLKNYSIIKSAHPNYFGELIQ